MTLIVYICGLFDNLNIGVKIIETISIITTIYNVVNIFKSIKNKQIKNEMNRILTPGLFVYTALFLLFIIINYGRIFEDYDEFNHWAVIIKNMYMYNGYGTVDQSIVTFNEYPPFTACFQYILLDIKGIYLEDLVIISQNILYLSIIIPVCEKVDFNKKFKNLLIVVPAILIMPLILYPNFFINILVDGFLGILFAVGLFIIYNNDKNKTYKNILLILIITSLALTKTTGIILAILILIFATIKNKKNRLKTVLIISIIPIILTSAWYIKINKSKAEYEWDLKKTIQTQGNIQNKVVIKNFFNALFFKDNITEQKLSVISRILLLCAYSICIQKIIVNQENKKAYTHILMETIISFIIFTIGLLWMYLTIFKPDEAYFLASYNRYMNTILLTWLTINTLIICHTNKNINFSVIYTFVAIGIVLLPTDTVYTKYINKRQYKISTYIKRNYYCAGLKQYENLFTKNDKLYFISNTNIDNVKILALAKYEMMTLNIANEEPNSYGSKESFEKTLIQENYTYVYIYKVKENFKEDYKELFLEDIQDETLYKVNIDENNELNLEMVN